MMPPPPARVPRYKCHPEECDVEDRAKLVEYRAKREKWLEWYEVHKNEPNSIQQQIFSMIFIDLAYRTITEPRRTTDEKLEIAARSGLLAHLLDQCYVANQVLAIRRLLDKRRDVISVRHLLDDIYESRHLLTREIYVAYDGLPYDSNHCAGSHARHEAFDGLSGTLPSQRSRNDVIRDSVFSKMEQRLEKSPAKKLINLSHKFFAHAADLGSRGSLEYSGIKLADITDVHRAIIRVERAITAHILFIAIGRDIVPMPPLGLYKGLDRPYVPTDSIAKMHERWEELAAERNKWDYGIASELET
jgi:hypothetical protein